MSRKKPIQIKLLKEIDPLAIFESKVVKSGNGAVVKAFKRYLGKEVIIIVKKDLSDYGEEVAEKYEEV